MSGFLEFDSVVKTFGAITAADHVSLSIKRGEVFSLLGPSGCGKTTLLRMCAGFITPDSGRILLDGEDITSLPPEKRRVNTVFQNYALFPHLSIFENIAFGLRIAKRQKPEIKQEVERMLDLIDMSDYAGKRIDEISGGQKQRVALARALINKPNVLLLDEPLAALDLKLRQRMLVELDTIHEEIGITFLYVTHDQGEAMSISDTIAVMNKGRVEQIGKPAEIYEAPSSSFVAAFIGDTNFFEGRVKSLSQNDYFEMSIDGFGEVCVFTDKKVKPGDAVYLSLRPEKMNISADMPQENTFINRVYGNVEEIVYLGSHTKYWVRVKEYRLAVYRQHSRFLLDEKRITWGDSVWLSWHADDGYMLERYSESDEWLLSLPDEESFTTQDEQNTDNIDIERSI